MTPTERLLRDIAQDLRIGFSTSGRTDWCIEITKDRANALLRRIDRALAREQRHKGPDYWMRKVEIHPDATGDSSLTPRMIRYSLARHLLARKGRKGKL